MGIIPAADRATQLRLVVISSAYSIVGCSLLLSACSSRVISPHVAQNQVQSYASMNNNPLTSSIVTNVRPRQGDVFVFDHETHSVLLTADSATLQTGNFTKTANGFLDVTLQSGKVGNWAMENVGNMGFLYVSQLGANGDISQAVTPFVGNLECPLYTKPQQFHFLSYQPVPATSLTAYGNVTLSTSGDAVNLVEINRYIFPGSTITGVIENAPPGFKDPADTGPSSASGLCGQSTAGKLTSVIGSNPNVATIGIKNEFLMQDSHYSGVGSTLSGITNLLGSGYGAVGLIVPPAALDVSAYVASQYSGFMTLSGSQTAGFSQLSAFSNRQCDAFSAALALAGFATPGPALYGGEFPGNDPSAQLLPNCDTALALGLQDPKENGLYTSASLFSLDQSTGLVSKSQVIAIAGSIQGRKAIFVSRGAQGIYLLEQ